MTVTAATTPDTRTAWQQVLEWIVGTPLAILLIVVFAVVSRWLIVRAIDRVVARAVAMGRKERLGENKKSVRTAELSDILLTARREQRARSIGQLLRSVVTLTVSGIAVLLVMGVLGLDIAPLLASAGVIGVALGFGAQTLVKDYLSGIFLIMEDQYGVGDLVDLGPVIGHVEEVALRVTRVRDLSGVVWYVRNGEILRVGNRSQGWTIAIVDVPVAYDENLERVKDLINTVGTTMDDDPTYDDMLLGPPTYAGVESVSGEAVYVRITAKAAPDQQVPVTREIRERVKAAFDGAGVRVPVIPRMPPGPGLPPGSPRG